MKTKPIGRGKDLRQRIEEVLLSNIELDPPTVHVSVAVDRLEALIAREVKENQIKKITVVKTAELPPLHSLTSFCLFDTIN